MDKNQNTELPLEGHFFPEHTKKHNITYIHEHTVTHIM